MNTRLMPLAFPSVCPAPVTAKELFRVRFQRALRSCVRRQFSVAECFGVIWLETLEEVALTEPEQSDLYEELIAWAKSSLFPEVIQGHSPGLFTGQPALNQGCPGAARQGG
jgi:hypothetical protein